MADDDQGVIEASAAPQEPLAEKPKDNSKEFNFRALEARLAEERAEKLRLQEQLKQLQPAEEESYAKDDLVTFEALQKREKKIKADARREFEEELNRKRAEELPVVTKIKYSDYESIVTPENIEKLIKEDPDLDFDIRQAKNPYERVYKEIKKSTFWNESMKKSESQQKLEENKSKPKIGGIGKTRPLANAEAYKYGSTEIWEQAKKVVSGRN